MPVKTAGGGTVIGGSKSGGAMKSDNPVDSPVVESIGSTAIDVTFSQGDTKDKFGGGLVCTVTTVYTTTIT